MAPDSIIFRLRGKIISQNLIRLAQDRETCDCQVFNLQPCTSTLPHCSTSSPKHSSHASTQRIQAIHTDRATPWQIRGQSATIFALSFTSDGEGGGHREPAKKSLVAMWTPQSLISFAYFQEGVRGCVCGESRHNYTTLTMYTALRCLRVMVHFFFGSRQRVFPFSFLGFDKMWLPRLKALKKRKGVFRIWSPFSLSRCLPRWAARQQQTCCKSRVTARLQVAEDTSRNLRNC